MTAAQRDRKRGATSHVSVIVADDHDWTWKAVHALLQPYLSAASLPVRDGITLLDAVAAREPTAVIADVSMPVLGGLEAMRALRGTGIHDALRPDER